MPFTIFVDDNFHFMDESERYELGVFPTLEAALTTAQKIVEEYLQSAYVPGMTSQELYASYQSFGEDPFIIADPPLGTGILFSAWDYAKLRCDELGRPTQDREPTG